MPIIEDVAIGTIHFSHYFLTTPYICFQIKPTAVIRAYQGLSATQLYPRQDFPAKIQEIQTAIELCSETTGSSELPKYLRT